MGVLISWNTFAFVFHTEFVQDIGTRFLSLARNELQCTLRRQKHMICVPEVFFVLCERIKMFQCKKTRLIRHIEEEAGNFKVRETQP